MQLYEKSWLGVVSSFTANGTLDGKVTVASTDGYSSKQKVNVTAVGLDPLYLEVKRVVSATEMYLGRPDPSMNLRTNLSAYTVALAAQISASEQPRPGIEGDSIMRAVYQEEPTVALRVIQVDRLGNEIGGSGGLASDVNVAKWGNVATSLGQKAMGSSVPVVLASDQSPVPVTLDQDLEAITPQFSVLAAAGVTATTPAGANTLITATVDRVMFTLKNTLNRTVRLTYNGAAWLELDHNVGASFDFASNGKKLAAGDVIGVYHTGTKPANGSLVLTLI